MPYDTDSPDVVADPVSHISISGVHGGVELKERLAHARGYDQDSSVLLALLLGTALGATFVYLLKK